jgi:hypothetical protein
MKNDNVYQVSDEVFISSIKESKNIHEALIKMGLNSRGAAYKTFKRRCAILEIDLTHFAKDSQTRHKLNSKDIITACFSANSRSDVLKKMGLNPHTGANINWINKQIKTLSIDINHWSGQAHLKGKSHNWSSAIDLSKILVKNSTYLWTTNLKKRLIKENFLKEQCYKCGITHWQGQLLSLQLEHINGCNSDNTIDNLILLCPNCHSLTPTFSGKNIGHPRLNTM